VAARTVLVAILGVAGLARFWAIDFCLPAPICRPDEEAVVSIATRFFARDFNPNFFDWPALFMYVVAAGVVVFFKVGLWLHWFRGEYHFLQTISEFPAPVFLIARLVSATTGVVSVWLVFRIAIRLWPPTTALIAAAFMALAFLNVRDSHFGVTDVTATCLALAAVLYLIRFDQSNATRDLLMAALLAGLATSTKYGAALVALPALWICVMPNPQIARSRVDRLTHAGSFLIVMGLAFTVTSPYCLIAFDQFIGALRGVSIHLSAPHGVMLGRGWLVHLTSSLRYGLGIPLLAAGLAGCVLLYWLFPVAYYATVGSAYTVFARYAVPLVPFFCLTGALTVTELARLIAGRTRWAREVAMAWVLAAFVIGPSVWSVVQFDRLLARADSRVVAASWIAAHVPRGALIEETGSPWTHVYLRTSGQHQDSGYRQFAFKEGDRPDVLIIPTSKRLPADDQSAAAMALAADYRRMCSIDAYDPEAEGLVYDWQDEFYLPLTGFGAVRMPGPSLTVYARPDFVSDLVGGVRLADCRN
jgi:Dolichyl-phosphate-mannose-protein mannosyltransferase